MWRALPTPLVESMHMCREFRTRGHRGFKEEPNCKVVVRVLSWEQGMKGSAPWPVSVFNPLDLEYKIEKLSFLVCSPESASAPQTGSMTVAQTGGRALVLI